jgi:drug/metabolite transporter (DMT)-like permease
VRPADTARLLALAAIWGAGFIFMRVIAPVLGPVWMAEGRVLIGGLALAGWFALTGFDPQWRKHLRFYALVGVLNSAIPFSLYGFSSLHLPASLMAILNATSPMFGLLLGAAFSGERITPRKIAGLFLGAAGVALVTWRSGGSIDASAGPMFGWSVAACLGASFAYGVTGVIMKRWGAGVPSRGIAVGTQLCAAAALLPLLPLMPPLAAPSAVVAANLVALGVLASGVAFILYFRLMADVGATRALTVTFLVPVFAFAWGLLFLGETLTPGAIGGALLILAGTLLVTR